MRRFLIPLLLVLLAAPVGAQDTPPPPPERPVQRMPRDRATVLGDQNPRAEFRLADQYLRAGQPDRAIALLEDLYAQTPSAAVYAKLKQAYEADRRFDAVAALIERRLADGHRTASLLAELGNARYSAGHFDEAQAAWAEALDVAPEAEMTYRIVAMEQGQLRLFEQGVATLQQGRAHLGDAMLYRSELANLCGFAADYACAADEYLALLVDNPGAVNVVQARFSRLIRNEGATDAIAGALERAVRAEPLNRAYRDLTAWIALERGDFAGALAANVAIDRLEGEEGQSLYSFAEAAVTAGAYDEAEQAYAVILERHAEGPMAPFALLGRARLAQQQAEAASERAFDENDQRIPAPRYELALEGYRAFVEQYPMHRQGGEALARAAALHRTVFRDYAAAEALLQDLAARPGDPGQSGQARLDLGRVSLQQGDLDAARSAFTQVEEQLRIGPLAEQARLELALLDFYEGDFAGALARVEAMHENTATDVANNAISLKVLLRENEGPDSLSGPLTAYAQAALLQRQQRAADALAATDALLSTSGGHPITDEAAFLRIEALRALGRTDETLEALAAFPTQHPGSYLIERTVFLTGDIHEHDLMNPDAAQATYTDLLTRFPGSLLAPEARQRLRRLRGDRPPG